MEDCRKKQIRKNGITAGVCLLLFAVLTLLLCLVDVKFAGPSGTTVGLAFMNTYVSTSIGLNRPFYYATTVVGYFLFLIPAFFLGLGIFQWIRRKSLLRVDRDLFLLGGVYAVFAACYFLFEKIALNCRPHTPVATLEPEPSFPSTHAMLAVVVLGTAMWEITRRIQSRRLCRALCIACRVLMIAMVLFRFLSGVHWLTDILGGVLLGAALVFAFRAGADRWAVPEEPSGT